MNTIGIDYQQTFSIVCLGEGRGGGTRVRNVGDGLRQVIPNAVHGESLWGSRALEAGADIAGAEDGPWLAEPEAPQFWGHLYQRLYAFLGRIAPTSQKGYRTVIALQATHWRVAVEGVDRLCSQAGFGAPACISATDALLARHLAEPAGPWPVTAGDFTLTVVAAGDTTTSVCSYRIRREGSGMLRLIARDTTPRHLPYGQAHWAGRLLIHVTDLLTEPARSGVELAMRDSALEFGSRLRRSSSGRAVPWTGPFRDKLFSPLELTVADCCAWPESASFIARLPDLIRESAASLGTARKPDLILVGGIGALWPFAEAAAATVGLVRQSGNPEEDGARGAAWWPEVEALWADLQPILAGPALPPPIPDWLAESPASFTTDLAVVEHDNPFLPAEERPSFSVGETAFSLNSADSSLFMGGDAVSSPLLESPLLASFHTESLVLEERVSPFDRMDESSSAGQDARKPEVQPSAFDLPTPRPPEEDAEELDLDALPPWDPRRNEL